MASIENSLKYETDVEPGKVRLVSSDDFVRAYNHSAGLLYCGIEIQGDTKMLKSTTEG